MSDDTISRSPIDDNPGTRVFGLGEPVFTPGPALGARESFLVAFDRLALLASVARGPSVVVAAVDPSARVVESLCLADRRALIVGRHTRCGLRLGADTVSLRHVAALARFEDGRPVVRVWDLRAGSPFFTEDQQPNGAVFADGALYVAIEGYALWFIPTEGASVAWSEGAEAAWRSLPPRAFLDRRPPAQRALAPAPARAPASFDEHTTQVTRLGPPLLIGEGDEPEVAWGVVRLAGGGRREKRSVSAERLEQGVLFGRYERCGMMIPGEESISRVHLLLVRLGAEVWAIDTASTNGVAHGGQRLAAAVLDDTDALVLGTGVTLDWQRLVHAEA